MQRDIDGVEVVAGVTSFGNTAGDPVGFGRRVDVDATAFLDRHLAASDPDARPPPGASDPDDEETDGQVPEADDAVAESVSGGCTVGSAQTRRCPSGSPLLASPASRSLRAVDEPPETSARSRASEISARRRLG